jgi:serine protease AprX
VPVVTDIGRVRTRGKGAVATRRSGRTRLLAAVILGVGLAGIGTTAAKADLVFSTGMTCPSWAYPYTSGSSSLTASASTATAIASSTSTYATTTALAGSFFSTAGSSLLSTSSALAGFTSALPGMTDVIISANSAINPSSVLGCVSGSLSTSFSSFNSIDAYVPSYLVPRLQSIPGITVTPDVSISLQSAPVSTGPHTPSDAFLAQSGASAIQAAGDTGQGVGVAVLDTGIQNLPDFFGHLLPGVDFTGDNNAWTDDYGHGTFVAGLIAGNGASSGGQYSGEAPGANLIPVKVATGNGQTDLKTVLKAINWVIKQRPNYNIKVLNLSLGTQPTSSSVNNPLDQAVEAAWNAGIAVVASAGNAGPFNGTILSPGDDPLVITVGAVDDMAGSTLANDEMNDFSSAGPTNPDGWIKPDLVASGRSVVSVTTPGSTIWAQNPSARIGTNNFVGSGTSFSAAITSGAAALVIADNPGLTPNQVKARLLGTTNPGPVGNPFLDGHGILNVQAAATSGDLEYNQSLSSVTATPMGTTVSLSPNGSADTWNTALWSGAAWNGAAWNGAAWNGAAWNGAAWNGAAWNGAAWNSSTWAGAAWNGAAWNGAAWNGAAWNGAAWNGAAWNGAAWNGAAWN